MKKFAVILLTSVLCLSFTACDGGKKAEAENDTEMATEESSIEEDDTESETEDVANEEESLDPNIEYATEATVEAELTRVSVAVPEGYVSYMDCADIFETPSGSYKVSLTIVTGIDDAKEYLEGKDYVEKIESYTSADGVVYYYSCVQESDTQSLLVMATALEDNSVLEYYINCKEETPVTIDKMKDWCNYTQLTFDSNKYCAEEDRNELTYQYDWMSMVGVDEKYLELAKLSFSDVDEMFTEFMEIYKAGNPEFLDMLEWDDSDVDDIEKWEKFFEDDGNVEIWQIMTSYIDFTYGPDFEDEEIRSETPLFVFDWHENGEVDGIKLNSGIYLSYKDYGNLKSIEGAFERPETENLTTFEELKEEFLWADSMLRVSYLPMEDSFNISTDSDVPTLKPEAYNFLTMIYGHTVPDSGVDPEYRYEDATPNIRFLLDHINELDDESYDLRTDNEKAFIDMYDMISDRNYYEAAKFLVEKGMTDEYSEIHNAIAIYEEMSEEEKQQVTEITEKLCAPVYAYYVSDIGVTIDVYIETLEEYKGSEKYYFTSQSYRIGASGNIYEGIADETLNSFINTVMYVSEGCKYPIDWD